MNCACSGGCCITLNSVSSCKGHRWTTPCWARGGPWEGPGATGFCGCPPATLFCCLTMSVRGTPLEGDPVSVLGGGREQARFGGVLVCLHTEHKNCLWSSPHTSQRASPLNFISIRACRTNSVGTLHTKRNTRRSNEVCPFIMLTKCKQPNLIWMCPHVVRLFFYDTHIVLTSTTICTISTDSGSDYSEQVTIHECKTRLALEMSLFVFPLSRHSNIIWED